MDFLVLLPLAVFVVVSGVLLVAAFSRKGSVTAVVMGRRRIVLRSAAPPDAVYAWLTQYCPAGYSVDDADPARGIVIMSSRPTVFTWGFFYPIAVVPRDAGTDVHIGIKSRLAQYGPLVTRAHRELARTLGSLTQSEIVGG